MPPKRKYALSSDLMKVIDNYCQDIRIHRADTVVTWKRLETMLYCSHVAVHHDHNTTFFCALGADKDEKLHSIVWVYPGDRKFHLMFNTFMRRKEKIAMLHSQRSPLVNILQCRCYTPQSGSYSLVVPYDSVTRKLYNDACKLCVLSSFHVDTLIVRMLTADTVKLRRKLFLRIEEELVELKKAEEADCVIEENDYCRETLPSYGESNGLLAVKLEKQGEDEQVKEESSAEVSSTVETESTTFSIKKEKLEPPDDEEQEEDNSYIPTFFSGTVDVGQDDRTYCKRPLSPSSDSSSDDGNVFEAALKRERRSSW